MKRNDIDLADLIGSMTETSDPIMMQYFKGLERNELIINGVIDMTTIEYYIMPLREWDADENVEEIKITINCYGGDVFIGMALAETISKLKTKTTVEILGVAYSMGGFLVVGAKMNPKCKVVSNKFATFLIHSGSTHISGDSGNVDDTVDFYREFNRMMDAFMVEGTSITEEKLKSKKKDEWYLTSSDMLEYGLIDEII